MRLKLSFGILAGLAVAGCTPAPQSAAELRSAVNGGAFMSQQTTTKISRNYSAVVTSVRTGVRKCMNRTVVDEGYASTGYMNATQYYRTEVTYNTKVNSRRGFTELAMHKRVGNGQTVFGMKQEGFAYVADIHPASGGTELKFYGGKFGNGPINKAVEQWAKGGAIRCPDLP
ncbi:MAG: hypothetical protein GKR98_04560 [Boseongicola sp.]|nr:MAG: hypothetical protein GKR98_04560 [Boseongicola sp.]